MREIQTALVVGAGGGFGQVFTALLRDRGVQVTGIDIAPGVTDLRGDLTREAAPVGSLNVDLVLLCVPDRIAIAVLDNLDADFAPDSLIADICSVKSAVGAVAQRCAQQAEYVSIHPMFGPHNDFSDQNMVFIPVRARAKALALKAWLQTICGHVIETDVDGHDKMTAYVQAAAHAALACFAALRSRAELDVVAERAFATPIYRALAQASQDLVQNDAELYHNIQTVNPHAQSARDNLAAAVAATLPVLADPDVTAMSEMFSRLRDPQ